MGLIKRITAILYVTFPLTVLAQPPSYSLPSGEWHIISLPASPPVNANTVRAILGDDISPAGFRETWALFAYDSTHNGYEPLTLGSALEQGKGYWIIQLTEETVSLDMPAGSTDTPQGYSIPLASVQANNQAQWTLAGNPFPAQEELGSFSVHSSEGPCSNPSCDFDQAGREKLVHNKVWIYANNAYVPLDKNGTLNPWAGFWTATLENSNGRTLSLEYGLESNNPIFIPELSSTLHWQLQGTINSNYNIDIYDIDLFDSSKSLINQLQNSGKKVICYFSGGSYENWRADANQFSESDLGKALDGWQGERWLDIRSSNVKKIMQARLDFAKQKGCDGVEPDNMDGYTNDNGVGLTANDQLDFNRFIATQAHTRSLSVGLKNSLDQINELVNNFDFAVNEQCHEYNECDALMPFINQGKAVFNVEYKESYVNDKASREALCLDAKNRKFTTLVLPLSLDDSFRLSCI